MSKKTIYILIGLLIVFVLLFTNRSKKVNWNATFNEQETKPLDTKIFFEQLDFWFKEKSTRKIYTTFYEYDQHLRIQEKDTLKNYISVSGRYNIDETSFHALLQYVDYGNKAFISAYNIPHFIQDTLKFQMIYESVELKQKERILKLNNTKDSIKYLPKLPYGASYIKDTLLTKKLGYWKNEAKETRVNFVAIPYGEGVFYIHTSPEVFTNYQMLEAVNTNYISTAISYLPQIPVIFDKAIKISEYTDQSPLRYIMSKEALKWSWYLMLFGIALFMLFNAKRRQRIIPTMDPLKNSTTEFVQTVSTLHYDAEDYNGIIQKSILHFLEHIRSNYHLSTEKLNGDFIKKMALKTGKPQEDVQRLISLIIKMKSHKFRTKEPLIKLNKEIEDFYKK